MGVPPLMCSAHVQSWLYIIYAEAYQKCKKEVLVNFAWVTGPEPPKGAKDEVKGPEGPPTRSRGPEGP